MASIGIVIENKAIIHYIMHRQAAADPAIAGPESARLSAFISV